MASEITTKEVLETILEHHGPVSEGGCGGCNMVDSKEFLPRVRVSESADGFEIETFYTCSYCGEEK